MTKKTILFVAMPDSIHSARWITQLQNEDWDIHLFPSTLVSILHPKFSHITVHYLFHDEYVLANSLPKSIPLKFFNRLVYAILRRFFNYFLPNYRARQLAKLINKVKPDIIHSLEFQHAGYLTLAAKQYLNNDFPIWILTNWGNDIYQFVNMPKHEKIIRQLLEECDFYDCECQRDVELAKKFGFNKTVLPVLPNTGGFDLATLENIRKQQATSQRNIIMLKGYHNWNDRGRALIALQAFRLCSDVLQEYTVVIYSADKIVIEEAALFSKETGVKIQIVPRQTNHDDILAFHAKARVSIGLNTSDGISISLLEAMVMGSLPIQSCTACADEWIAHGVSGAIVPPEDPEIVAMWLRKALTDDDWVNQAAELNWQTALARLDGTMLAKQAVAMYSMV